MLGKVSKSKKMAKKTSDNLISIIGYYDGLRSDIVVDPKKVLKKTKAIGEGKKYLKQFSKETQKVIGRIRRSHRVKIMVRANRILQFISIVYFMIVVVAAVLFQREALPQTFHWLLSFPSLISLFIIVDISLLILSLTRYEIKKHTRGSVKGEKIVKQRLKEATQYYIDKLKENIEKYELEPEDYEIKLHRTDYEGIKIVKKPGILRGHYLVIVNIKK
jgi:t-SNARE complex subunit (syntaxin)